MRSPSDRPARRGARRHRRGRPGSARIASGAPKRPVAASDARCAVARMGRVAALPGLGRIPLTRRAAPSGTRPGGRPHPPLRAVAARCCVRDEASRRGSVLPGPWSRSLAPDPPSRSPSNRPVPAPERCGRPASRSPRSRTELAPERRGPDRRAEARRSRPALRRSAARSRRPPRPGPEGPCGFGRRSAGGPRAARERRWHERARRGAQGRHERCTSPSRPARSPKAAAVCGGDGTRREPEGLRPVHVVDMAGERPEPLLPAHPDDGACREPEGLRPMHVADMAGVRRFGL